MKWYFTVPLRTQSVQRGGTVSLAQRGSRKADAERQHRDPHAVAVVSSWRERSAGAAAGPTEPGIDAAASAQRDGSSAMSATRNGPEGWMLVVEIEVAT